MSLPESRSVLARRHFAWLTLGFLALAVYGSLVPFAYQPFPLDDAVARFREVTAKPVRVESRSDWAANILLFLPLGFLAVGALAVDRSWFAALLAALVVVPVCGGLSAAIEFVQIFFPPRIPSINDMAAETLGGATGALLWLAVGAQLTRRLRQFWMGMGEQGPAGLLLPLYLIFLVLYQALPFDLTISPVEIYHKYKEGRLVLWPFAEVAGNPFEAIQKHLINLFFFLPVGVLLAGLPSPAWRQRSSWLRILLLGAGLAALVEVVQLVVLSHTTKSSDVLVGCFGVLFGWVMGVSCGVPSAGRVGRVLLWIGYLALLVFVSWQPFDFEFSWAMAMKRLGQLSWVPFVDYFEGDYLHALEQFVEKTLLFVPLGALLAPLLPEAGHPRRWAPAVLASLLLELCLEGGQIFLPTRYPSISDVLVAVLATWTAFVSTQHALKAGPAVGLRPNAAYLSGSSEEKGTSRVALPSVNKC